MDTTPTPELNEALRKWRAGLTDLAPDDVAELESHLLDSRAELRASGLSKAEAFEVAAARLGSPGEWGADVGTRGAESRPAGGQTGAGRREARSGAALANAVAASYLEFTADQWRRGWDGRKETMKQLLEEKTAAVESARQELLRVVQLHGITDAEPGSQRADEVAQPLEGQSSEVLPGAEPGRWEAGRAKQAYQAAQAALADASETMAREAQIDRLLTIHEFATERPDYSKSGDRQRYWVAGALGLLALSLLALGRRMVRSSRRRMRRGELVFLGEAAPPE